MKKLISVIVPVYNTSMYLRQCLDSIKNQTLKDIEVIVVDDGSTDDSPAICDEYSGDSRFRIFHNKNHGLSYSRNFGFENCCGDYCLYVDSDDWIDIDMCEVLLDTLARHKADYVICGHYNEATSGTTEKYIYKKDTSFTGSIFVTDIYQHTLGLCGSQLKNPANLDKLTPVWARLYNSEVIRNNNIKYIDTKLIPSEALDFNLKYLSHCSSAFYIHKPLYHYRRNNVQSVTKSFKPDIIDRWVYWNDYMLKQFKKNIISQSLLPAFYSRLACSIIPMGGNAIKIEGIREQIAMCSIYLKNPIYVDAFRNFDYSSCPIYWRLFFWSAKTKQVHLFYLLTKAMRKILDRRKK